MTLSQSVTTNEASRFLSQASLGANLATVNEVAAIGYEAWVQQQFALPIYSVREVTENLIGDNEDLLTQRNMFRYALWDYFLAKPDHLRQRVTLALSEIFVISDSSNQIRRSPIGMADYHDMLARNAFGNFRDLLEDVTRHPCMGFYLSHAGNRKADLETGRFPDENYAREIMQLFTIGLVELNRNGTPRLDQNGEVIDTFDNEDITHFARTFTGLFYDFEGILSTRPNLATRNEEQLAEIVINRNLTYFLTPMIPVESQHDTDVKNLLNGATLPAGQTVDQDIDGALDNLFNHPNTPPFISYRLIQRLVTSNPSPSYVERVATVFENNGSGIRGDMRAVIHAILMDTEARNRTGAPSEGKMREPWVRMMNILKAFSATNLSGSHWNNGNREGGDIQQRPYSSPSVFNFFSPFYAPKGAISDAGLRAPEFQITTTQTVPNTINLFADIIYHGAGLNRVMNRLNNPNRNTPQNDPYDTNIDKPWILNLDYEKSIAVNDEDLINHLNMLLLGGLLNQDIRSKILSKIASIDNVDTKVRFAIYLISLSPNFVIQK